MKIAIAGNNETSDALVHQNAGRAPFYFIFEDSRQIDVLKNPFTVGGGGAGIGVAKMLENIDVEVVVSGKFGENMIDALEETDIKHIEIEEIMVKDVLGKDKAMKLLIPVSDINAKNSIISDHFGHCVGFYIYNTDTDGLEYIDNNFSHSDPQKTFVDQIMEKDFDQVFSLGMGQKAISLFSERGIAVVTVDSKIVSDILSNLGDLRPLDKNCGH